GARHSVPSGNRSTHQTTRRNPMTTNTVLDDSEKRLAAASAQARTGQNDIVESMRAEIGGQHYTQAKVQLPELERVLADTYRPFLARVASQEARAKAPLPAPVKAWLTDMATLCDT